MAQERNKNIRTAFNNNNNNNNNNALPQTIRISSGLLLFQLVSRVRVNFIHSINL
jgi:hypothetical protein